MQSFHHVTSKEVKPELLIVQRINHIVPAQKSPIHHIRKNPALAARAISSSVYPLLGDALLRHDAYLLTT